MSMERFDVEGGAIHLLATVQGLVAERERVRRAFYSIRPKVVALSISPESVTALANYQKPTDEDDDPYDDLPDAEYAYSVWLAKLGEVALPPPDLLEGVLIAKEHGVVSLGADLTELAYVEAFTEEVGAFALLRYGRVLRKLAKRPPKAADPHAFSLAWDEKCRRIGAIDRVERRREAQIALSVLQAAREAGGDVLLVVDAPRALGVATILRQASTGLSEGSKRGQG